MSTILGEPMYNHVKHLSNKPSNSVYLKKRLPREREPTRTPVKAVKRLKKKIRTDRNFVFKRICSSISSKLYCYVRNLDRKQKTKVSICVLWNIESFSEVL